MVGGENNDVIFQVTNQKLINRYVVGNQLFCQPTLESDYSMTEASVFGTPVNQLWILNHSGLCLFHTSFITDDESLKMDRNLFSGFITAITSFAKNIAQSQVRQISLDNMVFHQYADEELIICLSTSSDFPPSVPLKLFFESLLGEFRSKFGEILSNNMTPDLGSFADFQERVFSLLNVNDSIVELWNDEQPPGLETLVKVIGPCLVEVVTRVIVGELLAFVGDFSQCELLVDWLQLFVPFRSLKSIVWTNEPNLTPEIVGIAPHLASHYKKAGYHVITLNQFPTNPANNNKFVQRLINDLRGTTNAQATQLVKTRSNYFFSKISSIYDLYYSEDVSKKQLRLLRDDIDADLLELIIRYIRNNHDAKFSLPSNKNFLRKLERF